MMNTESRQGAADASFMLGRAWFEKKRDGAARRHFEAAIDSCAEYAQAHRYLGYLSLRGDDIQAALAHLQTAAHCAPDNEPLQTELAELRLLAGHPPPAVELPDNPAGRFRFCSHYDLHTHHRSGWRYAIEQLYPLHNGEGVLFEDFLEDPFAMQHPRNGVRSGAALLESLRSGSYEERISSEEKHIVPYRQPWVGFLHNPPNMPVWFHYEASPQSIMAKPVWAESLPLCKGFFTLSEYMARWLRETTGKPASALLHPTAAPALEFDMQRFLDNPAKKIVQIGWWLRRLSGIYHLPIAADNARGYQKVRLVPNFFPGATNYLDAMLSREFQAQGQAPERFRKNTVEVFHIANNAYDSLLAENIVFIQLYDASANNTVIECLARCTPVLVNPLPAVMEYLGGEYPLYYSDLEDAARKAMDIERLRAAHQYLHSCETRPRLDGAYFRQSLIDSEVYQLL